MPETSPHPRRYRQRAMVEARCLGRAVIPMPEDNGRKVAKAVAFLLVITWCATTVLMTVESVATVSPPFYGAFTAVTFALVGKLWDIEVKEYMPGK